MASKNNSRRFSLVYNYIGSYIIVALSIKNEKVERLTRKLASVTGESLTDVILTALEERWRRLKSQRRNHSLSGQVEDLLRRVDNLPNLDSRSADEIIGYDEQGLPR
jgi:antitoxin VapB